MKIKKGGCLAFGRLIGDHQGIWIDISNKLIFGFNPPPLSHPNARRLKMKDPRCVKRYNDKLDEDCEREQIYYNMDSLHNMSTDPLTAAHQVEYEEIDKQLCEMMEAAELQCRKLCTGAIAWSPTYKMVMLALKYWRMRKTYKLGLHRNIRQLIVLQNKLKIKYNKNLILSDIIKKIQSTARHRLKIKIMAVSLSLEYRTKLALAKEEAGEVKAAVYICNLNRIEQERKLFQNIRIMENRIKGGSTSKNYYGF